MQKALSTLPWVEQDSIRASTSKQTVTIPFRDPKSWDEKAVRDAIENIAKFKTGKVLSISGPDG